MKKCVSNDQSQRSATVESAAFHQMRYCFCSTKDRESSQENSIATELKYLLLNIFLIDLGEEQKNKTTPIIDFIDFQRAYCRFCCSILKTYTLPKEELTQSLTFTSTANIAHTGRVLASFMCIAANNSLERDHSYIKRSTVALQEYAKRCNYIDQLMLK